MTTLEEELRYYRQFAQAVWEEDSGLAVWGEPQFQGIQLLAEAESEDTDAGD